MTQCVDPGPRLANPVIVQSVTVLDIDADEIASYDASGNLIDATSIVALGNGSTQTVAPNVSTMQLTMSGSGALVGLVVRPIE